MKLSIGRFFAVALAAILLLTLCACGNAHNAAVYGDRADEWINADFAAANYTSGIYIDGVDTVTDADDYPRSRSFIVNTQERYDEIFKPDTQISVDFDYEMLVVCTFTSTYVRPVEIAKLKQNGETLSVTLEQKRTSDFFLALRAGAACQPYQRYVVLKMDKLDVTTVELTVKH